MRLATFSTGGQSGARAGEVRGDKVVAFTDGSTVLDRLTSEDRSAADGEQFRLSEVELLSPHRPPAIFCIGWNYLAHAHEAGQPIPDSPLVFLKLPASAGAPNGAVSCPPVVEDLDYEGELTVVMGAEGRIAGYTVADDVSARDLQRREGQWTRAKAADGFCPFGPWITTADEVPAPEDLALRTWVNGELRQDARTNDLIFGIDRLLAHIGETCKLEPGALILTGTPSGVGMGFDPPRYLSPGDVVLIEIESLGAIEHAIT